MPLKPAADDRKVLLIAAGVFVLLLVGAALFAPSEQEEIRFPSSYSAQSGGAKAAYLLLKESGYNVERWLSPPQQLPQGPGTLLILAEPFRNIDKPAREALQMFLVKGGRVLAIGGSAASMLPEDKARFGADTGRDCPT